MDDTEEIAIVGVGCRFPGAENLSEYWRVLKNGENHVKEVPKERWNLEAFYDADPNKPGKTYVRKAGFINRYDEWDHRFFGVSEMEAVIMDPQQRIVLECVHMALEDGGITRKQIEGTHTAVYIGVMNNDYKNHVDDDTSLNSTYMVTGTDFSIISARVSYIYNLLGPAMTIDTACSSSLVAINLGSQALKLGECETAVCGGVNLLMDPRVFIALAKARMLSPTGQCQTYSADADGYARSEGCGIVILKRLQDAIKDGNKIWATIKTATNQDGHLATPITAPSGQQQIDLLERIYEKYPSDKEKIQVIEAHGTGTQIGDPVESNALGTFFTNDKKNKRNIFIGSVKTNVGHLESAAGVAGLIKVLLMIKYKTIVPSLMYTEANENPKINFKGYGFVVPTQCIPWIEPEDKVYTACVNSFGFGGTNAHAIIKSITMQETKVTDKVDSPFIVTFSATDNDSLRENIKCFIRDVQNDNNKSVDLPSLSYTTTCKRDHLAERKAFVAETVDQLVTSCQGFVNMIPVKRKGHAQNKIVFVLCGVGTVWNGMCQSLLEIPTFSDMIESIDSILLPLAGWTIRSKLDGESDLLKDPLISHISIFACQVGLAAVWKSLGINPDAVVGQSVGEVAAAFIAGKIDVSSAVQIIFFRSKYLSESVGGSMAVVNNIPLKEIEDYCLSQNSKLSIAVYNSPMSCTVAGDKDALKAMLAHYHQPSSDKRVMIELDVQCAYHSHHVNDAAEQIVNKLKNLKCLSSETAIFSTVTGKLETGDCFSRATYWGENIRKPVLFSDAVIASVSSSEPTIFIEIGPGPVLRTHTSALFKDRNDIEVLPSLKRGQALPTMRHAICKLYEQGFPICWDRIVVQTANMSEIPTYSFQRQKLLHQSETVLLRNQGLSVEDKTSHLYIERLAGVSGHSQQFKALINNEATPFVFEHFVKSYILVPGAFHADIGFYLGEAVLGIPVKDICVTLEFLKPIRVEKNQQHSLSITSWKEDHEIRFHIKQRNNTMCKGNASRSQRKIENASALDLREIQQNLMGGMVFEHDELYRRLKLLGFEYGDCFHIMKRCFYDRGSCLAEVEVPLVVLTDVSRTILHPCILDGLFQTTMTLLDKEQWQQIDEEKLTFLPVAVEAIRVYRKPVQQMFIYTKKTNITVLETVVKLHYDSVLFDTDGKVVAEILNYTTYSKIRGQSTPDELKYKRTWHPVMNKKQSGTKRLLILTNSTNEDLLQELQLQDVLVYHPDTKSSSFEEPDDYIDLLNKAKTQLKETMNAIVVIFDQYRVDVDIDFHNASKIYRQTKQNCWFLVELIRYLSNENMKIPLFIVTQNTQGPVDTDEKLTVDFVGSEIWGFMSSIQLEFLYNRMILLDLQPSLKETKETFFDFIGSASENMDQYGTEMKICHDRIYSCFFSASSPSEMIPTCRAVQHRQKQEYFVRSKSSTSILDPYFHHLDSLKYRQETTLRTSISLRLKSVYRHSSTIYPTTKPLCKTDDDTIQQAGHTALGVEYEGYPTACSSSQFFRCQSGRVDPGEGQSENEWEQIAVFPTELSTVVRVPRDCSVSLKDLPFYQSGLLVNSILSWVFSTNVPKHSRVLLKGDTGDSLFHSILKKMLVIRREAKILNETEVNGTEIILSVCPKESNYKALRRCKHLLCFKHSVPADIYKRLVIDDKIRIKEIDTTQIFLPNEIAKLLRKTVSWLKKNIRPDNRNFCQSSRIIVPENFDKIDDTNSIEMSNLPCRVAMSELFDKSSIYIVTGGLTGLGWELLLLLAQMGAGTIASFSRRAVAPVKAKEIQQVEKDYSCKILCLQVDVTDLESLVKAINALKSSNRGPIRGVLHGAGTLESALVIKVKQEQYDMVMKPKVLGTMNMHIATRNVPLDFFFLQSSITSIIGAPGQSNYGAANSFMDSFAKWRRSKGLPAQAINWGALNVGMAARPEFKDNFEKRGYYLIPTPEIFSCFQQAIMQNSTEVVYAKLDWQLIGKDFSNNPTSKRIVKRFEKVISERVLGQQFHDDADLKSGFDIELVQKSEHKVQREMLTGFVKSVAKRILENDIETYTMSSTFGEIGIDSMSSVTFTNVVYDMTRFRIEPRFMVNPGRTLNDIVTYLQEKMIGKHKVPDTDKQTIRL